MNVIILTEGGKDYGFGHVARCSSIYQAFRKFCITPQFIVNGDKSIDAILQNIDYTIYDWQNMEFADDDIVIIDSYHAPLEFYQKIAKTTALAIYIDDNNRIDYPDGTVVNGTILATTRRNDALYGSKYIPLRQDFWNTKIIDVNDEIRNVLITLGGNDLRNLTPKILNLLKNEDFTKKVIIGNSFDNVGEIEEFDDELIYSPDSRQMLEAMESTDLAISSAGQTLYELARVGVPTIAVGVVDNQINNIKNWQKQGFIEFAGFWDDEDLGENILAKLELLKDSDLRKEKQNRAISAVDGKGSLRIAKTALNKYYRKNSVFREIKKEDCLKIFEIANDEEVRKSSFNCDKIDLETHKKWFNRILNDDTTGFMVLEYGQDIIGQLRFDFDEKYPVISISLNKKYRGLGLSKYLLNNGINYIKENYNQNTLIADIKKSNARSISFFEAMGFKKEYEIRNGSALRFIYRG